MNITVATSDEEIAACFPVMKQLRPHLEPEEFVPRVRKQMLAGYKLVYVLSDDQPVAVAGYRVSNKLSAGKFLFVDDLVTDESARSKGYGARLLTWLREQARSEACSRLQLDTGIQRKDAQRFYEREGMRLSGYHYEVAP